MIHNPPPMYGMSALSKHALRRIIWGFLYQGKIYGWFYWEKYRDENNEM